MQARCGSFLMGYICPDDLCRNSGERTLCGGWIEDLREDEEEEIYDEEWP